MAIEKRPFGVTKCGEPVSCYTLRAPSLEADILDYGATIQALRVQDRAGQWRDVVLGYDTIGEYETNDGYLGACIGRVANRLDGAEFTLNGTRYPLAKNDGDNTLHGGDRGFDKYVWDAEAGEDFLRFTRTSPDGEEGYPGTLRLSVTYRAANGALELIYDAVSDRDTLCNLTNHAYWNLNGGGTVLEHTMQMNADAFLENTDECSPTGKILAVEGTPMDFRTPKPIGKDIELDDIQLRNCGGYDHNFCLRTEQPMHEAAILRSEQSGITMRVLTTLPGIQVYSANVLTHRCGKHGATYGKWDAVCLETQFYPNSMKCAGFEKPILKAGAIYHHVTKYCFSTEN